MTMDELKGEYKGVKWESLSPTSAQIRAKEVERLCRTQRKMVHELFTGEELYKRLTKPVDRLRFYQRTRLKVR